MTAWSRNQPLAPDASSSSVPKLHPFDQSLPSKDEVRANVEMLEFLSNEGALDTAAGEEKRMMVIKKVETMLREWAIEVGRRKGVDQDLLVNGGGIQVHIFGSMRLSVHNIDSDIDMLCTAPSFITRSDFFSSFCEMLSTCSDVDSLLSLPEAFTPVVKFEMLGQLVDMVFASLQMPSLPEKVDVLDLKCLRGLDEVSVRSLNGLRVAEWIYKLVQHNLQTYQMALRTIKFWAKQRGLYSNVLGFLGGINFAILVALVCKMFVHANTYRIVKEFFTVFSLWPWPKSPVMLREFEDLQFKDSDGRYLPVWNPYVNPRDKAHIMPIVTPAYPAMNSAYNVSLPQFRRIRLELFRAYDLFRTHPVRGFPWRILFEDATKNFFQFYPRYVQIDVSSSTARDHRKWFGWVESRLRMLMVALDKPNFILAHPMANCFHRCPAPAPAPAPAAHEELRASRSINNEDDGAREIEEVGEAREDEACQSRLASIKIADSVPEKEAVDFQSDAVQETQQLCPDLSSSTSSSRCPSIVTSAATAASPPDSSSQARLLAVDPALDTEPAPAMTAAPRATKVLRTSFVTPDKSESRPAQAVDNPNNMYISSFFIGLSFHQPVHVDVQPIIEEFRDKLNSWPGRKPDMGLDLTSFGADQLPAFVQYIKAEPSNIKSCTPTSRGAACLHTEDDSDEENYERQSGDFSYEMGGLAALVHDSAAQAGQESRPFARDEWRRNHPIHDLTRSPAHSANAARGHDFETTYQSSTSPSSSSSSASTSPSTSPSAAGHEEEEDDEGEEDEERDDGEEEEEEVGSSRRALLHGSDDGSSLGSMQPYDGLPNLETAHPRSFLQPPLPASLPPPLPPPPPAASRPSYASALKAQVFCPPLGMQPPADGSYFQPYYGLPNGEPGPPVAFAPSAVHGFGPSTAHGIHALDQPWLRGVVHPGSSASEAATYHLPRSQEGGGRGARKTRGGNTHGRSGSANSSSQRSSGGGEGTGGRGRGRGGHSQMQTHAHSQTNGYTPAHTHLRDASSFSTVVAGRQTHHSAPSTPSRRASNEQGNLSPVGGRQASSDVMLWPPMRATGAAHPLAGLPPRRPASEHTVPGQSEPLTWSQRAATAGIDRNLSLSSTHLHNPGPRHAIGRNSSSSDNLQMRGPANGESIFGGAGSAMVSPKRSRKPSAL